MITVDVITAIIWFISGVIVGFSLWPIIMGHDGE